MLEVYEISLRSVYISTIQCEKQCLFNVALCVHVVHWSVLMGIKNSHSAINIENMTNVNRNVLDQKNLGKLIFSNTHNL
jgi:hypothetical protein